MFRRGCGKTRCSNGSRLLLLTGSRGCFRAHEGLCFLILLIGRKCAICLAGRCVCVCASFVPISGRFLTPGASPEQGKDAVGICIKTCAPSQAFEKMQASSERFVHQSKFGQVSVSSCTFLRSRSALGPDARHSGCSASTPSTSGPPWPGSTCGAMHACAKHFSKPLPQGALWRPVVASPLEN